MEVLFTFLAERYERRSVIITSNLVFSEWDRIFKDPMTTAAAIDRLVHHSVILEMTGPSVRADVAERALREANQALTTTTSETRKEVTSNALAPKAAKSTRRHTKPRAATSTIKKSKN